MIHEYAIDPAFLLDLANQAALSESLIRALAVGTPCITAGYPNNLGADARARAKSQRDAAREPKAIARCQDRLVRVTELAAKLTRTTTTRHNAVPWGQDFAPEHHRFPFAGILSSKLPVNGEPCRNLDWLRTPACHLLTCQTNDCVLRTAQAMNEILLPLLQNAAKITFVDPYFFPNERFRDPYRLHLASIAVSSHVRVQGARTVTIVCAADTGRTACPATEFKHSCEGVLPSWLPEGLTLNIYRIKNIPGKQEVHNRYILSDIGGVSFGHGTDRSDNDSYDDINLLSAPQFSRWKAAYTPGSPHFDWSEPPVAITRP